MSGYTRTGRTTLKRKHERGVFDRARVHAILDEALICHVAFEHDGAPALIPTAHWRSRETLYIHGSSANRALRALAAGGPACIAVTFLDALVMARSAFHHSFNYRSVIIYGSARNVSGEAEKLAALKAFMEKVAPGRWAEMRAPSGQEMKATTVLAFDLDEVSAKIRDGGVLDEPEDMDEPVWAGIVPVTSGFGTPERDPRQTDTIPLPAYLKDYKGPR